MPILKSPPQTTHRNCPSRGSGTMESLLHYLKSFGPPSGQCQTWPGCRGTLPPYPLAFTSLLTMFLLLRPRKPSLPGLERSKPGKCAKRKPLQVLKVSELCRLTRVDDASRLQSLPRFRIRHVLLLEKDRRAGLFSES